MWREQRTDESGVTASEVSVEVDISLSGADTGSDECVCAGADSESHVCAGAACWCHASAGADSGCRVCTGADSGGHARAKQDRDVCVCDFTGVEEDPVPPPGPCRACWLRQVSTAVALEDIHLHGSHHKNDPLVVAVKWQLHVDRLCCVAQGILAGMGMLHWLQLSTMEMQTHYVQIFVESYSAYSLMVHAAYVFLGGLSTLHYIDRWDMEHLQLVNWDRILQEDFAQITLLTTYLAVVSMSAASTPWVVSFYNYSGSGAVDDKALVSAATRWMQVSLVRSVLCVGSWIFSTCFPKEHLLQSHLQGLLVFRHRCQREARSPQGFEHWVQP